MWACKVESDKYNSNQRGPVSKEIRLGPRMLSEWDGWYGPPIFENVIHIPEEDDIAVVYGPNRSGKSTIIRAMGNTLDLRASYETGWDDQIGIDPPYTLKFIDETKLSDNHVEKSGLHYIAGVNDMELGPMIDAFEEKGLLSKRNLWAANVLMINNREVLDRHAFFLPRGVHWAHTRILEEGGEHLFIDLRGCKIRTVSQLEVGYGNSPVEKESYVSVELGGVDWPMFWADGSPGWARLNRQAETSGIDFRGFKRSLLRFYSANLPTRALSHYASNPAESATMRKLLDMIFEKNNFADSPDTVAKLSRRDVEISKRTKKELIAILKALDDMMMSQKIMSHATLDWLSLSGESYDEIPLFEKLIAHSPVKIGRSKKEISKQIEIRFRAVIFHRMEPEIDERYETGGMTNKISTGHFWSVETEVLFPDISEEESREMIRGLFGIHHPSTSHQMGMDKRRIFFDALSDEDEEEIPSRERGVASHLMRHATDLENEEKQEVFMALKELLPQRFSFTNGRYFLPQTKYEHSLSQNGLFSILYAFRISFRDYCSLIWWEDFDREANKIGAMKSVPAIRRLGPRDAARRGEQTQARSLRLDVDRVSGSKLSESGGLISMGNPNLALQESSGLDDKLRQFAKSLPSSEEISEIADAMNVLISQTKAESLKSGGSSKRWYLCAAPISVLQYQYDDEYCPPRHSSDHELNLTDLLGKAEGLLGRGLIESHYEGVNKVISVYNVIKAEEVKPEDREEFDQRYFDRVPENCRWLKSEAKWGEYEGTEMKLIYDFESLINKLYCSLSFIQAATDITEILLEVSKDGEVGFHTTRDQQPILSSGEKHVFAMLVPMATLVLQYWGEPGTQIVMIDEPEVSLHVKWQREFYECLNTILKEIREIPDSTRIKVILATHSPEFIGSHEGMAQRLGPKEEEYEQ